MRQSTLIVSVSVASRNIYNMERLVIEACDESYTESLINGYHGTIPHRLPLLQFNVW